MERGGDRQQREVPVRATDIHAVIPLPLAVGIPVSLIGDNIFETAAGQALNINLSAATAVGGWLEYSLE